MLSALAETNKSRCCFPLIDEDVETVDVEDVAEVVDDVAVAINVGCEGDMAEGRRRCARVLFSYPLFSSSPQ